MSSSQDVDGEVRRNRRRVRVRKATTTPETTTTTTTTTNSTVDGRATTNDDLHSSPAAGVSQTDAAGHVGSSSTVTAAAAAAADGRVRRQRTPMTTVNGNVGDCELTSTHQLLAASHVLVASVLLCSSMSVLTVLKSKQCNSF